MKKLIVGQTYNVTITKVENGDNKVFMYQQKIVSINGNIIKTENDEINLSNYFKVEFKKVKNLREA